MREKMDVYNIYLESENPTSSVETTGNYRFNLRLPAKKIQYHTYKLYVDNWNVALKGLTTDSAVLKLYLPQNNSYSSLSGGNNTVVASIFNPNIASGRTVDLALNYQNATAYYGINALPQSIDLQITDVDNVGIDFSNAVNFFDLSLRIEAFYDIED